MLALSNRTIPWHTVFGNDLQRKILSSLRRLCLSFRRLACD